MLNLPTEIVFKIFDNLNFTDIIELTQISHVIKYQSVIYFEDIVTSLRLKMDLPLFIDNETIIDIIVHLGNRERICLIDKTFGKFGRCIKLIANNNTVIIRCNSESICFYRTNGTNREYWINNGYAIRCMNNHGINKILFKKWY